MTSKTLSKLVYMANQIATAFRTEEHAHAVKATWDHLWHFWDPRMREMIIAHVHAGGEGLNPIAKAAVIMLHERKVEAPPQTRATEFNQAGDPDLMSDAGRT